MIAIWEDLDVKSSENDANEDEEPNFYLTADTDSKTELKYDLEELMNSYDELIEESNCLSKAFKTLKRQFVKLLTEHEH